jgi:glutathione S-transferase
MPLEHMLRDNPVTGLYCHGDSPTLADICLVPLLRLALEAGVDPGRYPTVARIHAHCISQPAFAADD